MKTWIESHCKSRAHCLECRNDANFRASIVKAGMATERDFECPEGAKIGQTENLPQPKKPFRPLPGGSTDHEKEAAKAGYVPSCCGSAANPKLQS
jgi:hypothetical protein